MKTIKYMVLLIAIAASFSSCVVRDHRSGDHRDHHQDNPYDGRHQ